MDWLGIQEICIILIVIYVLFTCNVKRRKLVWIGSVVTDSIPWMIIININRFHDVATDLMQRKKGTYAGRGAWFGSTDFIGTVDPANIHYVTTSNVQNYPKGDEYRKIFEVMGYALFNSDDEDWKQHRRLIHTSMKNRSFQNYSMKTAYTKIEQTLVPLLKHASKHNDHILDMQDVFQRFALDVVCTSLTGHDPESLAIDSPNVPFLGALADFEGGIIYRIVFSEFLWKLQLFFGVGPENKMNHARKVINSYISNIVSKKRHKVLTMYCRNTLMDDDNDDNNQSVDFLTTLMKIVMKDGFTQITDINDEVFFHDTILQQLIAGRDTSSSALTWFIWLMVMHPEVEQKIRNEINVKTPSAKTKEWRAFNHAETINLIYLHAALIESMRLYPPVPFQYKSPRQPDILPSGHQVHPKTKIVIPLYAMARMKWIWGDNCLEFVPERWILDGGTIKHEPSSKYFIFYGGPRSCLGKDSAMTQMKMVAATLVHNFQFELVKGHKIEPDVSMILHVKHGLKVKVHNRWG